MKYSRIPAHGHVNWAELYAANTPPAPEPMRFIVAATIECAHEFARRQGWPPRSITRVHDAAMLCGYPRGKLTIHVLPGSHRMRGYAEIMTMIVAREHQVVRVQRAAK